MDAVHADDSAALCVVARNVRTLRGNQGLTQSELASKADVSLATITRVEKQQSVRRSSVRKIAKGLNVHFDSLFVPQSMQPKESNTIVYRAADATWFALSDKRPNPPEGHFERQQDVEERARLGGVKLVPAFAAPPKVIMRNGPGLIMFELYNELDGPFNAELYEDSVLYVVRGSATVKIGGEVHEVSEGDWIGYDTPKLESMARILDSRSATEPALLLWIGANRVDRKIASKRTQA